MHIDETRINLDCIAQRKTNESSVSALSSGGIRNASGNGDGQHNHRAKQLQAKS
jgi:hypothetical protein